MDIDEWFLDKIFSVKALYFDIRPCQHEIEVSLFSILSYHVIRILTSNCLRPAHK